jgi:hypothetical protein
MDATHPTYLTFGLGLLTALALFAYVPKVESIWRWLLVGGICAQIAVVTIQFVESLDLSSGKRAAERDMAELLYFVLDKNQTIGNLRQRILKKKNPYALAYWDFKSGDYAKAKTELKELGDKRYPAQAHYLLAVISADTESKKQSPDYSEAMDELEKARKADDKYASTYYLRAILRVRTLQLRAGLEDLRLATASDEGNCVVLVNGSDAENWRPVLADPSFQAIQKDCKVKYDL